MPNYRAAARRAARRHGLDPSIFARQIGAESSFNPRASSGKAYGIAQITPETARAWGVDPSDPIASLDAAAKHMAQYVRKYGGYENALRAYNAGPGAIQASKGYKETNAYVAKILQGKGGGNTSSGGTSSGGGISIDDPGSAIDVTALLAQLQAQRPQRPITTPQPSELLATPSLAPQGYQAPISTPQESEQPSVKSAIEQLAALQDSIPQIKSSGGGSNSGSAPTGVTGSQIKELFWQGPGGIDIKNGKRVPQGFVSGHQDHVHVAAGPKTVRALGRLAQQMGLHVGENPAFGGVDPVHVQGSYHYSGRAIDVSGDVAKMRRFAKRVARYSRTGRL